MKKLSRGFLKTILIIQTLWDLKDGSGLKIKGTQFNTAGWTAVEVAGKIIEKIGPILATKY